METQEKEFTQRIHKQHGQSLNDYFETICLYADPTATCCARDATMTMEVCDASPDYEYLPTYQTKKGSYCCYLWESGIVVSIDNFLMIMISLIVT